MKKQTWDSFTKKIYINAPIEKLYWCWTTQEGICLWFLKNAIYERNGEEIESSKYLKIDDNYTWLWHTT